MKLKLRDEGVALLGDLYRYLCSLNPGEPFYFGVLLLHWPWTTRFCQFTSDDFISAGPLNIETFVNCLQSLCNIIVYLVKSLGR